MKLLVAALVVSLTLSSCASYQQKRSDELMQQTTILSLSGKVFDACRSALTALDVNQSNESAKKFLQDNSGRAIDQKASEIESSNASIDTLSELRSRIDELDKFQRDSKRLGISLSNVRDIAPLKQSIESKVINYLLSELDEKIAQGKTKESIDLARKYKNSNLPNSDRFSNAIGKIQLSLASSKEIRQAIEFNSEFASYADKRTLQSIYAKLYSSAQSAEKHDKKLALDVYKYLGSTNYESFGTVKEKIKQLKNDLLLMICVSDVENKTDEMLPIASLDYAKAIKKEVDNEGALIEVMVEDSCMDDLRDHLAGYDYLVTNKIIPVKFKNNIRYILATKVSSLRTSSQPASVVTKNANWQGSTVDAISAGLKEYSAYGGYKVQYYQYDEYSAKSAGRIVFDYGLYDVLSGKMLFRDRGEASVEDILTWAENPMAVGIINKIPATVYPQVIESLIYKKRPLKSENEIKSELTQKMIYTISERIIATIKK